MLSVRQLSIAAAEVIHTYVFYLIQATFTPSTLLLLLQPEAPRASSAVAAAPPTAAQAPPYK
jgi:hypothetical protein